MSAVVVVEGVSDQIAVETLAARRGVDLAAAGVRVVPLGGAHRIGAFLSEVEPPGRLAALCDAGEEAVFRRALERAGVEQAGLYVCIDDLEDELIRAVGVTAFEAVARTAGDLERLRKLQRMPAWRNRDTVEQLRRFIAAGARRKARYARLLVDALDLDRVPKPLDGVLTHVVSQ